MTYTLTVDEACNQKAKDCQQKFEQVRKHAAQVVSRLGSLQRTTSQSPSFWTIIGELEEQFNATTAAQAKAAQAIADLANNCFE